MSSLATLKGLVIGIANDQSIAYGCARAFRAAGADLAFTYLNAKPKPYVHPLAESLDSAIVMPCDVREARQLEEVFAVIDRQWGRLDFVLHSIAYESKDDLHARVVDCSQEGFGTAMDVSIHLYVRLGWRNPS